MDLTALALLACPVGMGLMMWFMMKGDRERSGSKSASTEELRDEQARLQAQIDQLEARNRAGDGDPVSRT
jgi:hypothetical protein